MGSPNIPSCRASRRDTSARWGVMAPIAVATAGPDAMVKDLGSLTGAIGTAGINSNGAVFDLPATRSHNH